MAKRETDPFAEHIQEQLAPLGRITVRRMFGAAGVFVDGLMFGIIAGETLFLKADDETRTAFEAEGLGQISYGKSNGQTVLMAFWQAPERLLDDDEEMQAWTRKAIGVARRAAQAHVRKPPRRRGAAGNPGQERGSTRRPK